MVLLSYTVQSAHILKHSHFVAAYNTREEEHGLAIKQAVNKFIHTLLSEVSKEFIFGSKVLIIEIIKWVFEPTENIYSDHLTNITSHLHLAK